MVSVLITGTNQGLGLGLVKEVAGRTDVEYIFSIVQTVQPRQP